MTDVRENFINEIKNRGIFSEYLPKSYVMPYEQFNIYKFGGSRKDSIEPYTYTMSRFGIVGDRRQISIPDPSAYVALVNYIEDNDDIVSDLINLSKSDNYSFSRIIDSDEKIIEDEKGYIVDSLMVEVEKYDTPVNEEENIRSVFVNNMLDKINITKGACGILHIDISEFYRNIYTHNIATIKIGVDAALEAYNTNSSDPDYQNYKVLDEYVRALNGKRTNGLLIGPYISKIISEAILANVDMELTKKGLTYTRYADDYEFAIYSKEDIVKTKNDVARIFDRYSLRINNEKTRFEEYPFYIFSNFEKALGSVEQKKGAQEIIDLFNKFLKLEKSGEKGAIRYLLKAYDDKYKISDKDVFADYLVNVLCNDEKGLGLAAEIMIKEFKSQNIRVTPAMTAVLKRKLDYEIENEHEFEIIWLLYLFKHLEIKDVEGFIHHIWDSQFELAKVLILHEYSELLDDDMIVKAFNEATSWILLYEIAHKLNTSDAFDRFYPKLDLKHSKNFYKKLFEKNYTFYNEV